MLRDGGLVADQEQVPAARTWNEYAMGEDRHGRMLERGTLLLDD